MGHTTTNRASTARMIICACALALLCLALASPAQAAGERIFDPVLSLEGDCKAEDGVADPSCTGSPLAYPPGNPPKAFNMPCGTATDPHGSIYVANSGGTNLIDGSFKTGEVAVFDPQGKFLTKFPVDRGPCQLAVDSEGNVYVIESERTIVEGDEMVFLDRYEPDSYPPTAATKYTLGARFEFLRGEEGGSVDLCAIPQSVAVDPSNDHLYVGHSCRVEEYGSAAEGTPLNPLLDCCIGPGNFAGNPHVDVYGGNHDVYTTLQITFPPPTVDRISIFNGTDGNLKCELDGSDTPAGKFKLGNRTALAVDQSNGDFYVYDQGRAKVMHFGGGGEGCPHFIDELPPASHAFVIVNNVDPDFAVDAPCRTGYGSGGSCNIGTYESPNAGHFFATSGSAANNSHLFAFEAPNTTAAPPEVREQSATAITEEEAVLGAELNPQGLQTTYRFEYTTQVAFEDHGYEGAASVPVPDQSAGAGGSFLAVSAAAPGLAADTAYRFRLRASNCEAEGADPGSCLTIGEGNPGGEGEDASFTTYPATPTGLPDGRAYELVTPPDTHGHVPTMTMLGGGLGGGGFATAMASPDGKSLVFGTMTGSLPGIGGGGYQDSFEARRGEDGWQSSFTGLSGALAEKPSPGGTSPDHGYSFWAAAGKKGSLVGGSYLRVPSGSQASPNCAVEAEPAGRFEWIGCGSLGIELRAIGRWIGPGGEHVIFSTGTNGAGRIAQQLEPCAPPTGTAAVYDRTPGGQTHCVSLLPGDVTPTTAAAYQGASADGSAVAFTLADGNLYVRRDNAETLVAASGNPTFAGLSADGSHIFFVKGSSGLPLHRGELFACDLDEGGCAGEGAHEPIQIGSGGESVLVNVSADGSAVYFISPVVLSGEEENGHGAKAQPGEENLYAWDGEAVRFIATVSSLDVEGEAGAGGQGLGLWMSQVLHTSPDGVVGPAGDPSRSTPDGSVLVFQSHEDLTAYESDGHVQVYRYDEEAEATAGLSCISCNPTGAPATSDARLQMKAGNNQQTSPFPPANALAQIANVTTDGERAFFQSGDRLVSGDIDGFQDVYEWQAQGAGGCERAGGCLSLVSSGKSTEDDYLYAMTPDGSDVFFLSGDTLVAQDPDSTPSIYDARVEGGFPPPTPPPGECLGEACQPTAVAPDDPTPASSSFSGSGNVHEESATKPRCPKGKRKVRSNGKTRCVKRQTKKKNRKNNRANHNRRAAR